MRKMSKIDIIIKLIRVSKNLYDAKVFTGGELLEQDKKYKQALLKEILESLPKKPKRTIWRTERTVGIILGIEECQANLKKLFE